MIELHDYRDVILLRISIFAKIGFQNGFLDFAWA